MFECDGCGFTGSFDEVNGHIETNYTLPNGDIKDPSDIVCWGAVGIGDAVIPNIETQS